jgi:hypothetical protein
MSSSVLLEARRFLEESTRQPSSASSATTTTTTLQEDEDVPFIISIVDDNLHGAYEQELFSNVTNVAGAVRRMQPGKTLLTVNSAVQQRFSRATRISGALSLERLLADDDDSDSSARAAPAPRRAAPATSSKAVPLSRTVATASVNRAFGATPVRPARPSSAGPVGGSAAPRRASAIGLTPAPRSRTTTAAPASERRATLSPRTAGGGGAAAAAAWRLRESYDTVADLKRDFDAVLADLGAERDASWERQTAALEALEHLLVATPSDTVLVAVLGQPTLVRALVELIKSPRSALVRQVVAAVTKVTERLVADVRWRRRDAPELLAALVQTLASRTNVISECARDALVSLAPALPAALLLPPIKSMCGQTRDARLRRSGAELLAVLLQRSDGADLDDSQMPTVTALLHSLLIDADAEARRHGRVCYAAFCEAFPTLSTALEESLDPEARRVVARAASATPQKSPASPAASLVSPPSRLRAPVAGRAATTPPRRTSLPHATPTPEGRVASRLKQPAVFASSEARKSNIRKPVTRKLFLGDDGAAPADEPKTPPQATRSRSNSLEWFDSITSSPAVQKTGGLLLDDGGMHTDITPDDEALLRAAAAQLLREQQKPEPELVPAPVHEPKPDEMVEEGGIGEEELLGAAPEDVPNEW